jgi:catechol 2,3-dioxygenase-like lactoylglutathione lyase family enzyme
VLSHVSLGVRDLEQAAAFYDAVLGPLGAARVWSNPRGVGYGVDGRDRFSLRQATAGSGDVAAGPGFHLALRAPNRAAVDACHAAALARGARCDGPPGPRPHFSPTYYAAFLFDPDGHRLEVVHQ